jgi:Family of unknown function (DUF6527)
MKISAVTHEFIELAPINLKPGVLYISHKYKNMLHLCFCGCGGKVVTPLSPTGWEVMFDGKSVSVYPSIGNWNFECKSHYWIQSGRVEWAQQWSQARIAAGFRRDREEKRQYYEDAGTADPQPPASTTAADTEERPWDRLKAWIKSVL